MEFPAWLSNAVVYQIYPQSFQDSNGDGIGDFQGIITRLDYLKQLGVNALWLNPCFDSPFDDAGYDVRDFYRVAPRYGTEDDLLALFEAAHRRGMRVILDLVAGHTSMEHPWFAAEANNPKAPDSNRYIWKNRDFDPATGPRRGDFVANFFWYQPALNYGYEAPVEEWQDPVDAPGPQKNRRELRRIMAYWFDRGCDGFRVDMAASLVKGAREENAATIALWRDLRSWLDRHYPDRVLVAEWSRPDAALSAGFHLDFMMHFNAPGYPSLFFNGTGTLPAKEGPCYFAPDGNGNLNIFREEYTRQLAGTRGKGYISLPSANHDFQRLRCGERGWEGLRPAWVFLLTQAGIPTIYYGDEIGMRFVPGTPPREGSTLAGIEAPNAGAPDGERAGTRTPMQWDDSKNDGFSTAAPDRLYLPLDDDPARPTVSSQQADTGSIYHFIRDLLLLRARHPALGADGGFHFLNPGGRDYPMVYLRSDNTDCFMIAINPTARAQHVHVPAPGRPGVELLNHGCALAEEANGLNVEVAPFGYSITALETGETRA